ncbi:MAG: YeeE/YedE family protein [Candidatus Latescibacteria bacterium]|nr:YeeE/YedE family protein [Candidatus Latescibacterota bacterium]
MKNLLALLIGAYFGLVLIKAEVASWFRIQKMFRFEEAHMYLVIGSAVAVGALSLFIIKRIGSQTVEGEPIAVKTKPFTKGTVIGGVIFGCGWAITGACPGPIYAQMGSGEYLAMATFVGAFVGAYLYAWLRPRLPH